MIKRSINFAMNPDAWVPHEEIALVNGLAACFSWEEVMLNIPHRTMGAAKRKLYALTRLAERERLHSYVPKETLEKARLHAIMIKGRAPWSGRELNIVERGVEIGLTAAELKTKLRNRTIGAIKERMRVANNLKIDIEKPKNEVTKSRKCLTCSGTFLSHHVGERVCPNCKGTEEWRAS